MKSIRFVAAAALLLLSFTLVNCKKKEKPAKVVGPFSSIQSNGNVHITLVQGAENTVISTTLDDATYNATNGTLVINATYGSITIGISDLENISMNTGTLDNSGTITVQNFDVSIHAGEAELTNFHVLEQFEGSFTNSGTYSVSGSAAYSRIHVINNARYHGVDFQSDSTYISSMAAVDQEVYASMIFRTSIGSSGDVYYAGNPPVVDTTYTSFGRAFPY